MAGRKIRIPRLVKPVAAVMSAEPELLDAAVANLTQELGPVDLSSPDYLFDFSDYYRREMGGPLVKRFVSFSRLSLPEFLAPLKRRTAACERLRGSRPGGGRRVNVDPGYWSDAKLVLASTKNYSHRIAIGRRVFAEVTLLVRAGRLESLDWTYPDYRTELALDFFGKVRKIYFKQLTILTGCNF
ncbi:DUF4416 family protein [bacterium]|nr:DUF4416 family protein [bacterium]